MHNNTAMSVRGEREREREKDTDTYTDMKRER